MLKFGKSPKNNNIFSKQPCSRPVSGFNRKVSSSSLINNNSVSTENMYECIEEHSQVSFLVILTTLSNIYKTSYNNNFKVAQLKLP
jgi:hypothetical protein